MPWKRSTPILRPDDFKDDDTTNLPEFLEPATPNEKSSSLSYEEEKVPLGLKKEVHMLRKRHRRMLDCARLKVEVDEG